MPFLIEPMRLEDIEEIHDIERESFTLPWPASAYRRELRDNRMSRYIVARYYRPGQEPQAEGFRIPVTSDTAGQKARERRPFPFSLFTRGWDRANGDERQPEHPIVGYGGLWLMVDEAHITTLAVRKRFRGRGIGELLLVGLIDTATEIGATWVTLEVRVSNLAAQSLYRKYGFKQTGVRRRYYSDNNEDGLIMWSEPLTSAPFQAELTRLKEALRHKLAKAETVMAELQAEGTGGSGE